MVSMNKLLVDKKEINIINENKNIDLKLEKNSQLVINYYNDSQESFDINITEEEASNLIINIASITDKDCKVNINVLITGNNNKCVINVRNISKNGNSNFYVNVKSNENTKDNIIIEDLKGVLEDGTIDFLPILEIDTNEVEASHFATIGGFNQNEIFYLQSKGLEYDECLKILKKAFIYKIFNKDFLNLLERKRENE